MYSRKYNSMEEAIADLKSKGELKYFGWEGFTTGYFVYTFKHLDGRRYHADIYPDGLVKMRDW